MDYSPSGSSVHGDSPGKNIVMGYHALLQGIFPIHVSHIAGGFFIVWATREDQMLYILVPIFTCLKIFLASPAFQALEHMLSGELGLLPLWLSTLMVVPVTAGEGQALPVSTVPRTVGVPAVLASTPGLKGWEVLISLTTLDINEVLPWEVGFSTASHSLEV